MQPDDQLGISHVQLQRDFDDDWFEDWWPVQARGETVYITDTHEYGRRAIAEGWEEVSPLHLAKGAIDLPSYEDPTGPPVRRGIVADRYSSDPQFGDFAMHIEESLTPFGPGMKIPEAGRRGSWLHFVYGEQGDPERPGYNAPMHKWYASLGEALDASREHRLVGYEL